MLPEWLFPVLAAALERAAVRVALVAALLIGLVLVAWCAGADLI